MVVGLADGRVDGHDSRYFTSRVVARRALPPNLHRQNQAMKMNMDYRQGGGVPSLSLSAGMDSSTATNRRGSSICGFLLLKVEELLCDAPWQSAVQQRSDFLRRTSARALL